MIKYVLRIIKVIQKIGEKLFKILGPVFVLFALSITTFIIYVHFTTTLPWYFGDITQWGIHAFLQFISSVWISSGIYFNYFMSVLTDPGTSPKVKLSEEEIEALSQEHASKGQTKFCKKCKKIKPKRTHHCSVCNRCVLKMDHHCPWIANCVGFHNHHYFILFLIYVFVGTLYSSCLLIKPFLLTLFEDLTWTLNVSEGYIVGAFMLSISVCLAIAILMPWQLLLILTNQTSIEFQINRFMSSRLGTRYNPYDLGLKMNFEQAFGQSSTDWTFKWLVPTLAKPKGNGLNFEKGVFVDSKV